MLPPDENNKRNSYKKQFVKRNWGFNHYIFQTQCLRPLIFKTMNSVISNGLTYQRFTGVSG